MVRFEKWQALGNDYMIVEALQLPFPLSAARTRRLCDRHFGVGADGLLLLEPTENPDTVARLRIFNPDGSEAELSGNGAREAIMYLHRRGWVRDERFAVETAAGAVRPTITGPTTCTVDMGHARLTSADYPGGDETGAGVLRARGRDWRFQHVSIGNPQCVIFVEPTEIEELDIAAIGPEIERHELFPNRTNVSWVAEVAPGALRARIFERGVGETLSSGTGATGAAVAHVAAHAGSRDVTVRLDGGELQVEVGDDLHVDLTGWAVPVYAGELATELVEALHATE